MCEARVSGASDVALAAVRRSGARGRAFSELLCVPHRSSEETYGSGSECAPHPRGIHDRQPAHNRQPLNHTFGHERRAAHRWGGACTVIWVSSSRQRVNEVLPAIQGET